MTTEIEKTFFDTFGIEPKKGCTAYDKFTEEEADVICNDRCRACLYFDDVYPQITDTHYLKLICELSKCKAFFNNFYRLQNVDIEQLKEQVLTDCIFQAIFFKDQVRTLFEEG